MEIQATESIDRLATGLIRRSPKVRLLTLFQHSRPASSISFIGDYPLIAHLLSLLIQYTHRQVTRWSVLKTINNSVELSRLGKAEKTAIVDELLRAQELSIAQIR